MSIRNLAVLAVAGLASSAFAGPFSQLKMDINEFDLKFYTGANGTGGQLATVTAGGGLGFTGSWVMSFTSQTFITNNTVYGNNLPLGFGPYALAGTAQLTSFTGTLNFNAGSLTDGTFSIGVKSVGGLEDFLKGDFVNNGSSVIVGAPTGPFFIAGAVDDGTFVDDATDAIFGDNVDISAFLAAGNFFPGAFAEILVANNGSNADFDIAVVVPAPGSIGLALVGAGMIAARRRR